MCIYIYIYIYVYICIYTYRLCILCMCIYIYIFIENDNKHDSTCQYKTCNCTSCGSILRIALNQSDLLCGFLGVLASKGETIFWAFLGACDHTLSLSSHTSIMQQTWIASWHVHCECFFPRCSSEAYHSTRSWQDEKHKHTVHWPCLCFALGRQNPPGTGSA